MKTKFYLFSIFVCSVLLLACNSGKNKSNSSSVSEIKSAMDSLEIKDEDITKPESAKRVTSKGMASFLKSSSYDYVLDFSDPTTYSITCGKINPGQWSVKNDTCCLYTAYIMADVAEDVNVEFTFSVNQSGNGDVYDRGYVYHSIDNGDWEQDTCWTAGGFPAVYELTTNIMLEYGHYVQFMVKLATNDKTEFWAIFDGGIHADDGNDSTSNIHSYEDSPGSGLPVNIIKFSGLSENGNIILNWSTASEVNNDYFVIEKSTDGEMFSSLDRIQGAGNSNEIISYEYVDKNPSILNYYRLKQYDYDGTNSCSEIIKVSLPESEKYQVQVSCIQGTVYLMTNSKTSGLMKVNIYNLSGALVFESEFSVEKGSTSHTIAPSLIKKSIGIIV